MNAFLVVADLRPTVRHEELLLSFEVEPAGAALLQPVNFSSAALGSMTRTEYSREPSLASFQRQRLQVASSPPPLFILQWVRVIADLRHRSFLLVQQWERALRAHDLQAVLVCSAASFSLM